MQGEMEKCKVRREMIGWVRGRERGGEKREGGEEREGKKRLGRK